MQVKRRVLLSLAGLLWAVVGTAEAGITTHTFTTPGGSPIGFAYAGNKFVGTTYEGGLYSTDLTGGNVQTFGPGSLHLTGPNVEHFVAASSGYGGFNNRDIYIGEGHSIIHVTNDGTTANTFISGLGGNVRGILFDTIGSFNNEMLVTTDTGQIYQVNGAGVATMIAYTGEDTEGLDIAPIGALGVYSGSLLVASEGSGTIRSIDAITHGITNLFHVGSAEELSVVPLNLGASGNPLEGFYGANFAVDVQKADASQFAGLQGDIIITGETTHAITLAHFNGTTFDLSVQGFFPNQPEDGIFVTTSVLNAVPEPTTVISGVMAAMIGIGLRVRNRRSVA
jgi:hypothetical protein